MLMKPCVSICYRLRSFLHLVLIRHYTHGSGDPSQPNCVHIRPPAKLKLVGHGRPTHEGLRSLISPDAGSFPHPNTALMHSRRKVYSEKIERPLPAPPKSNFFSIWARRAVGAVLSLLLPFWIPKWKKLQKLEGEAEMVAEEVEAMAEIIEKAATVVEMASADAADKLPNNGKLKEVALFVEQVSKETAEDAHLTRDFIHKVDALKQDLEELEKMVEPRTHKTQDKESD